MSIMELLLIVVLSIILLKPNDIEFLLKTISNIIIKINKYIYEIKNDLLKLK